MSDLFSWRTLAVVASVLLLAAVVLHLRADHAVRRGIAQRYEALSLPVTFKPTFTSAGCDGLDTNACWIYSYTASTPWPATEADLETALKPRGFFFYTSATGQSLIAQSAETNLELYVAQTNQQIDMTVEGLTP